MRILLTCLWMALPLLHYGQERYCPVGMDVPFNEDHTHYTVFRKLVSHHLSTQSVAVRSVVTMPVVIHVVARNPIQPVTLAQVLHQIDILNADFAGHGENVDNVEVPFDALVSDVMIRFCLASTDPSGQATTGITYTSTDIPDIALQTGEGGRKVIHWDQLGGKTGWDPTKYINIWVGEYGSFLGSASLPGTAQYAEEIGIVIDPAYFGTFGDGGNQAQYDGGHTLTHEMGHYLGLKHIWGDGLDASCDDTDDIEDTPNAAGPYYGCPSGMAVSCSTADMYRNFMDFTDDHCLAFFTPQQAMVMNAAREVFYPDITAGQECSTSALSFESWYDGLTWAYDGPSGSYIIFGMELWPGVKNVEVFSMDGKLVASGEWSDAISYQLEPGALAGGVYVVRITFEGKDFVRKLLMY